MYKAFGIYLVIFFALSASAQEVSLPEDLRQHNLTQFNASLFNPTYSYDWNRPHAAALWSRWQWQAIDGDPTTLFVSYTHRLKNTSAIGGGFLQHNTGTFLNTGGVLNYAQVVDFETGMKLLFGANLFFFQQKLADDQLVSNNSADLSPLQDGNEFLLQLTPGARLVVNNFSVAIALENAFDYNFTESEREDSGRIFVGALSNDFSINGTGWLEESYLRPVAYVKTIPNADVQYGLNALFSASKFWAQGGYNSLYGVSAGVGVTLFEHLSLGGLIEFPIDSDLNGRDSSMEILLSYHFGKHDEVETEEEKPEEEVLEETETETEMEETEEIDDEESKALAQKEALRKRLEAERLQREKDSINRALADAELKQRVQDSINQALVNAERKQRVQDSITKAKKIAEQAKREQKNLERIAKEKQKEVVVETGEKYEEVASLSGLDPGFYLIANVFGTQRYFNTFMNTLQARGLNPKSFYRKRNGYNYVYLERFETFEEAREARDNRFFGKYSGKTWIFRVKND